MGDYNSKLGPIPDEWFDGDPAPMKLAESDRAFDDDFVKKAKAKLEKGK
jgi:hypothetical protein